jgi:uncharacterized protein YbcI
MKSNLAKPGGSSTSNPTWSNALQGVPPRRFFFGLRWRGTVKAQGANSMLNTNSTMAQQIAQAAISFEQGQTGVEPESATVVLSEDTLVVTLHGALSPAEKALSRTPAGAAQVQEFHRQLFTNSSRSLRQEITRITGVEVRESTAEVESTTGTVVHVFTSGAMVQVFLLARSLPAEAWSGSKPHDQS